MPEEESVRSGSLEEVVREEDFLPVLEKHGKPFFSMAGALLDLPPAAWGKGHLFRLASESHELESFLDDFGARRNRRFGLLGELVASLRWLAQAALTLQHTALRLDGYHLSAARLPAFRHALEARLLLAKEGTARLLRTILEQCAGLRLRLPEERPGPSLFEQVRADRYLPEDLDEEAVSKTETLVAELAARFLRVAEMVRAAFPVERESSAADLALFAARYCREEQLRVCQVAVHNLQSRYDTHIMGTPLESRLPGLPRLRGHISVVLHLLECATCLIHLDERHENDLRHAEARETMAGLLDRAALLDTVIRFCLTEVRDFLAEGSGLARQALSLCSRREKVELALPLGTFLHARPATRIIAVVQHHGLPVEIEIAGQRADASSIMAVMILAGKNPGERRVAFHGDPHVLHDLELLFRSGLDGQENGALPDELAYLRSREPGL